MKENILKKAEKILYQRAQEKERKNGDMIQGMKRASRIASGMLGETITPEMILISLIALKLSRASYSYNEDHYLDAINYLATLNDIKNDSNNN